MTTAYFTFGQDHVHVIGGIVYDKDCVLKITSSDPRETMVYSFGPKWAMQYEELPNLRHYPRGVIEHWLNPTS